MERRNKKLLRLFLSLVLVLCQAFSFVPVNADTAEEETLPKEKITSAHNGKESSKKINKIDDTLEDEETFEEIQDSSGYKERNA